MERLIVIEGVVEHFRGGLCEESDIVGQSISLIVWM